MRSLLLSVKTFIVDGPQKDVETPFYRFKEAMSDDWFDNLQENANDAHGMVDWVGHMGAINQRNTQIEQQRELAKTLKAKAETEKERLNIEKRRLEAEEAERALRRTEELQIKELRRHIADATHTLENLVRMYSTNG